MLLRLVGLIELQVELAKIFVGPDVIRIQVEGASIIAQGFLQQPHLPLAEGKIIVSVGVAGITGEHAVEKRYRLGKLPLLHQPFGRHELRVARDIR